MFSQVYEGARVLVTGHTGFKGAWLTAWLLKLGAEVAGFSVGLPSSPSAFAELGLGNRIEQYSGDVRDRGGLAQAVKAFKPEVIFHLAAQALVRPSYENPALTFETNALGTLNLLEAVRAEPAVRAVVLVTSDKCYRNDEWVWGYREDDHLGGKDPYSASKACAELVSQAYFHSFFQSGPSMATARAGNVIGGGDWALDRIVPDCARAWSEGRSVTIRNPLATRPWQHVLEPLSGYLRLGQILLSGPGSGSLPVDKESFNFGPDAAVNATVQEVCEALAAYWPGFSIIVDPPEKPALKESILLKLCCDKALAHLDWRAVLPFEETIRLTADWYRAFYQNPGRPSAELFAFTTAQISEYESRARAGELPWTI